MALQTLLLLFGISAAASGDSFSAVLAYSAAGIRIPARSLWALGLISGGLLGGSILAGSCLGELNAAKGEQTRIDDSLTDANTQADDSQRAIGDLVRRKYRDGNVDPVAVALTSGALLPGWQYRAPIHSRPGICGLYCRSTSILSRPTPTAPAS